MSFTTTEFNTHDFANTDYYDASVEQMFNDEWLTGFMNENTDIFGEDDKGQDNLAAGNELSLEDVAGDIQAATAQDAIVSMPEHHDNVSEFEAFHDLFDFNDHFENPDITQDQAIASWVDASFDPGFDPVMDQAVDPVSSVGLPPVSSPGLPLASSPGLPPVSPVAFPVSPELPPLFPELSPVSAPNFPPVSPPALAPVQLAPAQPTSPPASPLPHLRKDKRPRKAQKPRAGTRTSRNALHGGVDLLWQRGYFGMHSRVRAVAYLAERTGMIGNTVTKRENIALEVYLGKAAAEAWRAERNYVKKQAGVKKTRAQKGKDCRATRRGALNPPKFYTPPAGDFAGPTLPMPEGGWTKENVQVRVDGVDASYEDRQMAVDLS